MKIYKLNLLVCCLLVFIASCITDKETGIAELKPLALENVKMEGELLDRAMQNFDRLESDIYHPENVYPERHHETSVGWPGDKEGRVILGLVLQAQATHRAPVYLEQLIEMIPDHVNEEGYLGPIQGDTINEQQLSGHGWFLRALCEYYTWKEDERVAGHIQTIVKNLAIPTLGRHKEYPIDPGTRRQHVGKMAGTSQNVVNNWLLSSDIGCDFIFLDGVIHAYSLFPDDQTKQLIEEMIALFMEIDLVKIQAQTHATLTALRSLIRYYQITGEEYLLKKAVETFDLYKSVGMTENHENFNWFDRPEWTEPCAIVDAFMVACQLWQLTGNEDYLNDAHQIYYNALGHTQRANGGFGCDNCPAGNLEHDLYIKIEEAFWCCTMRGGEGLAKAIEYSYYTHGDTLILPFFHSSVAEVPFGNGSVSVKQTSGYPFTGNVALDIAYEGKTGNLPVKLFVPEWITDPSVTVDGESRVVSIKDGFVTVMVRAGKEHQLELDFTMNEGMLPGINTKYSSENTYSFAYGPLILGHEGESEIHFHGKPTLERKDKHTWIAGDGEQEIELTSVFHHMDPKVSEESGYKKQIIFSSH